jgi:hypothetical protein
VDLTGNDISEEHIASITKVERMSQVRALAVTIAMKHSAVLTLLSFSY